MSLKSFSENTIIYSIGTIALRFTSFLLIPLYTHYLSKEHFGLLQTLLFTIQVLITINDVGMRSAIVRFFSDYETKNQLDKLIGSSISINLFAGLFLLLIALMLPNSLFNNLFNTKTGTNIIFLTFLVGVTQTLSLTILSYFRVKDKAVTYMAISFASSIFLILSISIFLVFTDMGIEGILSAQIISYSLMWFLTASWIAIKEGLKVEYKNIVKLIQFGSPLILAMAGDLIISTIGIYLLGFLEA